MSLMSHRFRGWKLAADGETIPYEVSLVSFERPTPADLAQAAEMEAELRALAQECRDDGNLGRRKA